MNNTIALNPSIATFRSSSLSLKMIWVLMFVAILSLLIIYIFQINFLTREVYDFKNYEKNLTILSQENAALEINFSRVNSLENIENYLESQNFKKVTQVKYIHILETEIAKNQ